MFYVLVKGATTGGSVVRTPQHLCRPSILDFHLKMFSMFFFLKIRLGLYQDFGFKYTYTRLNDLKFEIP